MAKPDRPDLSVIHLQPSSPSDGEPTAVRRSTRAGRSTHLPCHIHPVPALPRTPGSRSLGSSNKVVWYAHTAATQPGKYSGELSAMLTATTNDLEVAADRPSKRATQVQPVPVASDDHAQAASDPTLKDGLVAATFGGDDAIAHFEFLAKGARDHDALPETRCSLELNSGLHAFWWSTDPSHEADKTCPLDFVADSTGLREAIVRQEMWEPAQKCNVSSALQQRPLWFLSTSGDFGIPLSIAHISGSRSKKLNRFLRDAGRPIFTRGKRARFRIKIPGAADQAPIQKRSNHTQADNLANVVRSAAKVVKSALADSDKYSGVSDENILLLGCVNVSLGSWQAIFALV